MKNFCFHHKTLIIKWISQKAIKIIVDPTLKSCYNPCRYFLLFGG